MTETIVCIALLIAISLLILQVSYNTLSQLRQQVRLAWGQMDQALKKRYDLLPDLAQAVQLAGLSQNVPLSAVSIAKNQAAVAFNPEQLVAAESALTRAIETAFSTAAAVSDRAHPQILEVQRQIGTAQQNIQLARQHYNDRVATYNTAVRSFPASLAARALGFKAQPMFELA